MLESFGTHPQLKELFMDPKNYRFTQVPLTSIFAKPDRKKEVARVFMGEWMKLQPEEAPEKGCVYVTFRGGKGWVAVEDIGPERKLEVFFIDVGQGDAILIQTPDDKRVLIDGGPGKEALRFIENKYRLDKEQNYIDFEAVIATHSDSDHTAGLVSLLKHPKIGVKRFLHNGLFPKTFKKQGNRMVGLQDRPAGSGLQKLMADLGAAIKTAEKNLPGVIAKMKKNLPHLGSEVPAEGFVCKRADVAMGFIPPFDSAASISLQILWPEADEQLSYPWYVDEGKTKNGNSVAIMLRHGDNRVLLSGDLNTESMADLVQRRKDLLSCAVYKAAHHGSQDFDLGFLKAVSPDVAVISSGDDRNSVYGHPRAVLLGTITHYSNCATPGIFSTELSACYQPLSRQDQAAFKRNKGQLYEKSIQGVIHLRSDGKKMHLGRVYGRAMPNDPAAATTWKWDVWPSSK
jgi:competence protein ComEC